MIFSWNEKRTFIEELNMNSYILLLQWYMHTKTLVLVKIMDSSRGYPSSAQRINNTTSQYEIIHSIRCNNATISLNIHFWSSAFCNVFDYSATTEYTEANNIRDSTVSMYLSDTFVDVTRVLILWESFPRSQRCLWRPPTWVFPALLLSLL